MVITYQGIESFRVQFGDTVLAFNPISKDSKFKATSFGSDIVLVTANHPDFNGAESASRGEKKESFVINGPGEYEVGGVFVKGFQTTTSYGGKEILNTIYTVMLEGMNICFLGGLGNINLPSKTQEALEEIDILFVPIGGDGVLDSAEAYKLAVGLEAKIIIPMHYGEVGKSEALKMFLKESDTSNGVPVDKLTLKKKDLEGKSGDIVVIKPSL